jgi:hypothetical protein
VTATSQPHDDLFHALAARARATSDGRLALAVIGGFATTLCMAVWRPSGWLIVGGITLCIASFGAWGIADRELAERGSAKSIEVVALRGVCVFSVALGACGAIGAVLDVLAAALGTWIS